MVSKDLCAELDDLASFEREMEEERKRKAEQIKPDADDEEYDSTMPENFQLPMGGAKKPRGPPKRKTASSSIMP